jgi:mannose-1-phosphate guanylyltransferase
MYAVIMAGGSGTRLWPLSRKNKPKQFHSLVGNKSLIRETFERLLLKLEPDKIIISTVAEYADEIKRHLPELPKENIIIEPSLRGNAAACGLVSAKIEEREPGAQAVFLPSDHAIPEPELFIDTLLFAQNLLKKYPNYIIQIGIKPTKPDVNLGYIKTGQFIDNEGQFSAFLVDRFVEKPDLETAKKYLENGKYLWNAGMFTWKTDQYLEKLKRLMPKTFEAVDTFAKAKSSDQVEAAISLYNKVENTSIDYGIIEKIKELIVIPGTFKWSDIGMWDSLLELLSEANNSKVVSKGNHVSIGDENSLIFSNDKLIATIGLKDIVVVDSPDALLICDRNKSADVKKVLERLKEEGKHLYL